MSKVPWVTGKWNDLPRYQCRQCSFDTLSEEEIRRHVESHKPAAPPVAVAERKEDRFGNVVEQGGE